MKLRKPEPPETDGRITTQSEVLGVIAVGLGDKKFWQEHAPHLAETIDEDTPDDHEEYAWRMLRQRQGTIQQSPGTFEENATQWVEDSQDVAALTATAPLDSR